MNSGNLTKETTALILAGGKGTRIAALVPNLPKPMVDVAGHPFLEWPLRRLAREGFDDILLSVGHMADAVIGWLQNRVPLSPAQNVRWHREAQPLGTGGAIAESLADIATDYTLILNGDTLLLSDFSPALARVADANLDGIILARSLEDTGRYGRLSTENGILSRFEEKRPGQGLINGGVYAFRTRWLKDNLGAGVSSFEVDILPRMLANGAKIGVFTTDAPFIDIGTPETLAEAGTFVTNNKGCF